MDDSTRVAIYTCKDHSHQFGKCAFVNSLTSSRSVCKVIQTNGPFCNDMCKYKRGEEMIMRRELVTRPSMA